MRRLILVFLSVWTVFLYAETSVMDIFIGTDKVGWYEMKTIKKDSFIEITENSKMSLTVYGNTMNVSAHSFSLYDKDWNMIKFLSGVESEQLSFFANGFIKDGKLIVKSDIAQGYNEDVFDIKDKVLLFNIESASKDFFKKDIYQYNPLTRRLEKVKIESKEKQKIKIKDKEFDAELYIFSSESGKWSVFFDKQGSILKSVSSEGITMVKTDSVKDISAPIDILNWFFISSVGNFKDISKADNAKYIIEGLKEDTISNYRQIQRGDTIEVRRAPVFVPEKLSEMDTFYLKSGSLIKTAVKEIMKKQEKDSLKILQNAMNYVNKKLKKGIYSGLLTSEDIMKNGYGDCTEHAQVFATIARELGFNADIVSGIVHSKDGFYYHAWNRVIYKNKIYTIDATFNQFDADVSHIQLSEGFPPMKVLITSLSGKVSVRRIE